MRNCEELFASGRQYFLVTGNSLKSIFFSKNTD